MNIIKSFSIYSISNILEKGISFALLPIFTFYFKPADYGVLVLLTTITTFTLPFITLGSNGAISANFFRSDDKNHSTYFTSAIIPSLISTILSSVLFYLISDYIYETFNLPVLWFNLIPIFCFISFFNTLLLLEYQLNNEPYKYVSITISSVILNLLLTIFLVVLLKFDYIGRLISQYFVLLFFFIISFNFLYFKRKRIVKKVNKEYIKDSLLFGLPLIPHSIGMIVINMSDKIFITKLLGNAELGIYNTGFIIGSSISILSSSFAKAIVPFSYQQFSLNTDSSKMKVVRIYLIFILVLTFIIILLWILSPFIFKVFIGDNFQKGIKYVFWVSIGFYFQGLYLLFANVIFFLKKTKIFLYWSFFNIIINLILNYIFVNIYGAKGAAITISISFFLFFIVISIYANKLYPLPWRNSIKILLKCKRD